MVSTTQDISLAPRGLGAVPRAVWVGGGLLGLVTAGLAGALVMKSVDGTPTAATVAQPVPLVATTPEAVVPKGTPVPPAAPMQRSKPVPPSASVAHAPALQGTTRAALCTSCGVVESVTAVQHKGEGTGLGAVAGGVLGGVVGHQLGGGKGKTALTVLGAVGGGLAGNEVEKRARADTRYNVLVRMEDGSKRTFERAQTMAVGTHVTVDGSTLQLAREAPKSDATKVIRTSAPPAGSST